jgi:hypothetical protein
MRSTASGDTGFDKIGLWRYIPADQVRPLKERHWLITSRILAHGRRWDLASAIVSSALQWKGIIRTDHSTIAVSLRPSQVLITSAFDSETYVPSKVLITGDAGFICFHVCNFLMAKDADV